MAGNLEFGIVQSDRQYQAWKGLAEWQEEGKQKALRSVFSIHTESITLVASKTSGITTLLDLKGKHINIGNPGSGQRQNAIDILRAISLNYQKDIQAEGFKAAELPRLLQDGRIDAFFYTVGHPSGAIKEATSGSLKVRFVPIVAYGIDEWVKTVPYYAKSQIPIVYYPEVMNKQDVPTLGMKATFVTSIKVPVPIVYAIVKEVFKNLDKFKRLHPAYSLLTKESMLEGLTAPIHPGALKYYRETGLKP